MIHLVIVLAALLVALACCAAVMLSKSRKEIEGLKKALGESKALSGFFADMSHEIRTPINTMTGFSRLIADTDDNAERKRYAGIIEDSSKQIQRLISDILDISKVDSGKMKFFPERFDFSVALDHECMVLGTLDHSNSVEFKGCFPYSSCMVTTDRTRLMQIVSNYVTNAFKYTSRGSVTVGYECVDDGLKVYVKDTGKGITGDPYVAFERFKRLDSTVKGTGLGLAICKSMAEGQGGKVGVESIPSVGSVFWVWLPCSPEVTGPKADAVKTYSPLQEEAAPAEHVHDAGKPEQKAESVEQAPVEQIVAEPKPVAEQVPEETKTSKEEPAAETVVAPAVAAKAEPSDPNRRKRLLIADDDDSNYLLFKVMLQTDYDLSRAKDGVEAVQAMMNNRYDAVLMDVRMPRMDGIEATERIRQKDQITPIIVVTASAFFADKEKSFKAGCTDFLTKPINKAELLATIAKHTS